MFFIYLFGYFSFKACCCRSRGCATYTLITQCVSLIFAACVIVFDSFFLCYPSTCFFSSSICSGLGSSRGVLYTAANFSNIKIPLIIGQLAAGAVMFLLCLIYILIYIITTIRVHRVKIPPTVYPQTQYSSPLVPTGSDGMVMAPPVVNVRPPKPGSPLYHRPMIVVDNGEERSNDLLCPTCSTMMAVTVRKKLPK